MLFNKAYEEEKIDEIDEMVASLQSMADIYLQANGIKAVPFVRYEGYPIYRIAIYTVNFNSILPKAGANVIFTYCLDRDIAVEKLHDAAIMLQIDEAYKLLALFKLEGY